MSFYASNDRILIKDTNGDISFDTNKNMPHIIGVYEASLSKAFTERYYTEEYFTIASLPGPIDFVICRANCTPRVMNTGAIGVGIETVKAQNLKVDIPWQRMAPSGNCFFQGSLLLEAGTTGRVDQQALSQYARRAMHVYAEPSWGNKLICMFQQGVKSGWGAVPNVPTPAWTSTTNILVPYSTTMTVYGKDSKSEEIVTAYTLNPANAVVARYGELDGLVTDVNTGAVIENWTLDYGDPVILDALYANGDITSITYGPCAVRWDVNLKVWVGRFRK